MMFMELLLWVLFVSRYRHMQVKYETLYLRVTLKYKKYGEQMCYPIKIWLNIILFLVYIIHAYHRH